MAPASQNVSSHRVTRVLGGCRNRSGYWLVPPLSRDAARAAPGRSLVSVVSFGGGALRSPHSGERRRRVSSRAMVTNSYDLGERASTLQFISEPGDETRHITADPRPARVRVTSDVTESERAQGPLTSQTIRE
eukprot:5846264-Prymnesium_polylepis.1